MKKIIRYSVATVLVLFGLLTLFLSGSIIFDLFGIRAKEGNYVLFVVWANFVCSILYLAAANYLVRANKFSVKILGLATILLAATFVALLFYVNSGGLHETKTIYAMLFRLGVTAALSLSAYFLTVKKEA